MKQFIGLDAHSQTCTFAVMNEDGDVTTVQQIDTNERQILSFLSRLRGELALTFEESFLSKWLFAILKPHVEKLIVCNPLYVMKRGDAKTDKLDAICLARELRAGNLVPVFHADQNELFELRTAVHAYQNLVHQIIQTKNRLKMLYRSEGVIFKGQEVYKDAELLNKLTSAPVRMVGDSLFQQLKTLSESKKEYQHYFVQRARKDKSVFVLTSIPGIESVRACIIAAVVCDARRFPSKHHFWSYCGLVRHKQISDGVVYGNKKGRGRPELKGIFHSAAITVQVYHRNSSLYQYFQDKQAVMRQQQVYRPEEPKTDKFRRGQKWFKEAG